MSDMKCDDGKHRYVYLLLTGFEAIAM